VPHEGLEVRRASVVFGVIESSCRGRLA